MAIRYFLKELRRNPIYDGPNPIELEPSGDDGLIAVDEEKHPSLYATLRTHAQNRTGGVRMISAERYEELKKNPDQRQRSLPPRMAPLRLAEDPSKFVKRTVSPEPESPAPVAKAPDAAVVAGEPALARLAEGLVKGETFKPRTGKLKPAAAI